jgi:hypothetical protein
MLLRAIDHLLARPSYDPCVPQPAAPRSTRGILVGLLLAVAFGTWVRTQALDALLPHLLEPDPVYVRQALALHDQRAGLPDRSGGLPHFYPLLLPWTLSWLPIALPGPPAQAPLSEHLAAAGAPYLWGRRLVALISIGIVPATWLLARALLTRGAALLAAAFAAASLVHVVYAQQARPHAAFVVLSTFALVAVLHLRRSGKAGAHVLAGGACALALACLHSGVFLLPALAAAIRLAPGRGPGRTLLAFAPVALAIPCAYPSLFDSARLEDGGVLHFTGHALPFELFGGRGVVLGTRLAWSFEPVLTALVVAASAIAIARVVRRRSLVAAPKRADLLVLSAFGAPFALVIGAYDQPWEKYWMPLVPLVCLFGAAAAERGAGALRLSRAARLAGGLALLAVPAWTTARFALVRTRPDSVERAAAWIESNLEREHERVLLGASLSLPLVRRTVTNDPVPDWALSPWDLYQRRRPELAARADAWDLRHLYVPAQGATPGRAVLERDVLVDALRDAGAGWLVLERRGSWEAPDGTRAAAIAAGAVLAASFEPYDPSVVTIDSRGWVLGYQAVLRALTANGAGPRVEVWRLEAQR